MNLTKKELSYFRLKLEAYLSDYHPELMSDESFISTRADAALTTYCDAVAQGFTHLEAEAMSSEVLYQGLHFSKYDTLVSILENEFSEELPEPLPRRLAPILLSNKFIQEVFAKYELTDDFDAKPEYEALYTELTGTIVLLIENSNLPTIGGGLYTQMDSLIPASKISDFTQGMFLEMCLTTLTNVLIKRFFTQRLWWTMPKSLLR